jgi:IS1 family transposase
MILMKICPKIETAADKLLEFYACYPSLLEKVLKYALDERDMESKERYYELLRAMGGKMKPWF